MTRRSPGAQNDGAWASRSQPWQLLDRNRIGDLAPCGSPLRSVKAALGIAAGAAMDAGRSALR